MGKYTVSKSGEDYVLTEDNNYIYRTRHFANISHRLGLVSNEKDFVLQIEDGMSDIEITILNFLKENEKVK